MELSKYNELTQSVIANKDDQGELTNTLAAMTAGFNEEIAARATAEAKVKDLELANAKLKEDNMKLFLQITVPDNSTERRPEVNNDPVQALYAGGRLTINN